MANDRAAVVTNTVIQMIVDELRQRLAKGTANFVTMRGSIESFLRDEFDDVRREAISEIRLQDE